MQEKQSMWRVFPLLALLLVANGQGADALPTSLPLDPVAARSHLPMPWRIIGASFVSLEKGEAGWLPGLMGDGYYLVDFDQWGLVWRHADIEDHYACTLGKDGAFEARNRAGTKAEGRVNLARGELVWQGKKYRVRTYKEIAAEKKGQEPALKPTDPESPVKSLDKDTLQIDLKSRQRGSGGLNFAMGGLRRRLLRTSRRMGNLAYLHEYRVGAMRQAVPASHLGQHGHDPGQAFAELLLR